MYIKNGKVKIANDITEFSINDLELADHLAIFESFDIRARGMFEESTSTGLTSMILTDIIANRFYLFDCSKTYSNHCIDSKFNEKTNRYENQYSKISMDSSTFHRVYFLNNDNKLMLIDESKYFNFDLDGIDVNEIECDNSRDSFTKKIFEKLFLNEKKFNIYSDSIISENDIVLYVPIKLDDDSYLVFENHHYINLKRKNWNTGQTIRLYNKNGNIYTLPADYEDFLGSIKKIDCYDDFILKRIDEINFVTNYEIEDYLTATPEKRNSDLSDIGFKLGMFNWNIKQLFEPMLENNELNLKIYPDRIKDCYEQCTSRVVELNGNRIQVGKIEDKTLQRTILDEIRVAQAISSYIYSTNRNGINPEDGLFYKDGVLDLKEMEKRKHFMDDEIVVLPGRSGYDSNQYFVKVNKRYLPANRNDERDNAIIKDYEDRVKLMKELERSAKMMGDLNQ